MVNILFWNIRRVNPKAMQDAKRFEPIMGVISQYSLVFIIENMKDTDELVTQLKNKLCNKFGTYSVEYQAMGGYKGTDEKIIVVTKSAEAVLTRPLYAIDKDGNAWDGKTSTFNRLLTVAQLKDGVSIGCVHFPGPQSLADHAAELTSVQSVALKKDVLMIGGDFNMEPPYGNTKWRVAGPFYEDNGTTKASPTTINAQGQFASPYDWIVVNIELEKKLFDSKRHTIGIAQIVEGFSKNSEAHHVSDHVPVQISYTLPPSYNKK